MSLKNPEKVHDVYSTKMQVLGGIKKGQYKAPIESSEYF